MALSAMSVYSDVIFARLLLATGGTAALIAFRTVMVVCDPASNRHCRCRLDDPRAGGPVDHPVTDVCGRDCGKHNAVGGTQQPPHRADFRLRCLYRRAGKLPAQADPSRDRCLHSPRHDHPLYRRGARHLRCRVKLENAISPKTSSDLSAAECSRSVPGSAPTRGSSTVVAFANGLASNPILTSPAGSRGRYNVVTFRCCCRVVNGTIAALERTGPFDTILYLDVLEHIADDRAELARAARLLIAAGTRCRARPGASVSVQPIRQGGRPLSTLQSGDAARSNPAGLRLEISMMLDSAGFFASLANRVSAVDVTSFKTANRSSGTSFWCRSRAFSTVPPRIALARPSSRSGGRRSEARTAAIWRVRAIELLSFVQPVLGRIAADGRITLLHCSDARATISLMHTTNDIRTAFLDYFAKNGHEIVASSPLVPRNDPDPAVHQRRDGAVQERFYRPRKAALSTCRHGAEMRARRRQTQRSRKCRLHHPASHIFRDARQFLVRRLFQGPGDRAGVEFDHARFRPARAIGCWSRSTPRTMTRRGFGPKSPG